MKTGENEQGLKQVTDLTRGIAIVVLIIHCYYECYAAFKAWGLVSPISDRLLGNIIRMQFFSGFMKTKLIALGFLLLSLPGVKGRKNEKARFKTALAYYLTGIVLYLLSGVILYYFKGDAKAVASAYIGITASGFMLIIRGGGLLSKIIKWKLSKDVFNKDNETFPQEERFLPSTFSLNLPARYKLNNKVRDSWINFVNARRSILLMGSQGSGKTYFVINHFIRQLMSKGMALFIFDQKFPELTNLTYNLYLKYKNKYPPGTKFCCLNFKNLSLSGRCNPIHPGTLFTLTSAIDAGRTLLLSMNKTWASRQGEFFVESPINLLAAVIWFLKKYNEGMYCTLPHAIELIQLPYEELFTILRTETEIATLINPFVQFFMDQEMETLSNQMASVKIPLGRLSGPDLYYILSGNDFNLDMNNPEHPVILCLGNNPQAQDALAPVMSLYIDRLNILINQQGKYRLAQVLDEFASIRSIQVLKTISTGRSNDIITVISLQDYSQLKLVYSREEAEVIFNICGNLICGQVSGESAKMVSERFAKTFQQRESISINSSDTSISHSKHLDVAIPPSTISSLSSGEFVGIVSDDPDQIIEQKMFHAFIINDHTALAKEKVAFKPLPVVNHLTEKEVLDNYLLIKQDVQDIKNQIMEDILNDPERENLVVRK
ncbi:MAG: conjugal transfer protein TraG [Chitinophagaceae bacterium]|nr:MAG: conjugal transfer protein TraG [Chitinophagaceae bacterium]